MIALARYCFSLPNTLNVCDRYNCKIYRTLHSYDVCKAGHRYNRRTNVEQQLVIRTINLTYRPMSNVFLLRYLPGNSRSYGQIREFKKCVEGEWIGFSTGSWSKVCCTHYAIIRAHNWMPLRIIGYKRTTSKYVYWFLLSWNEDISSGCCSNYCGLVDLVSQIFL